MYVTQTMELKDAEKPKPPFQHSCCVTGSSSGNGGNLLPTTCVWQLLSALSWVGPSSGSAEQDLLLSFSCISISHAAPGLFHQARVSRQSVKAVKILHLFIGEFSQDRNGRKTAHKDVLWHGSGTACGRPGMLQWVQSWLPPSAASAAALCWAGTWCSKALLAFTGHVPPPADLCYAVNWFVAQLEVCATT